MQERHKDRKRYFEEQALTTDKFVIPYLEEFTTIDASSRILEIGCGEGGNLMPFVERGCEVVGVDINTGQIEKAIEYTQQEYPGANARYVADDIYNMSPEELGIFDVIMMRDVIEHIYDQEKFMHFVKDFLKPQEGKFFLGFPPWYMPYGGHQQIAENRWASKIPYVHILPKPLYYGLLRAFGETDGTIQALDEIKDTGISIERFRKIIRTENYRIDSFIYYLINPNYETKFGLKPRKLWSPLSKIPGIRNFYTTCIYCILSRVD